MLRKDDLMVNRSGFTLIELVVVLMIIAVIAGLIVPQVAMLGRQADMAASAKTQADLANNIQLHFVQLKSYPQGLDSLLVGGTAVHGPADLAGAAATSQSAQYQGLPIAGTLGSNLAQQLTVGSLTNAAGAEYARSLTRSGFEYVFDHSTDPATWAIAGNANTTAIAPARTLGSTIAVAELITTPTVGATTNPSVASFLYPAGVPTNVRLVAFGIGPRNSMVPKTMNHAPIYPAAERYYGHYVAVFAIYASGERATLLGVVDAYGRTNSNAIFQYHQAGPDGGRQG